MIVNYRKRELVNNTNDDQDLKYAKALWALIVEKLYECPGTNDVILITSSQHRNDKYIKHANFLLGLRYVEIYNLDPSQYKAILKNLTTEAARMV